MLLNTELMSTWQEFIDCPFEDAADGTLVDGMNNGEFMFISLTRVGIKLSTIHIYNSQRNTWKQYESAPQNVELHTAAIDTENKILYVNDINCTVFKIDFKTDKVEIFNSNNNGCFNKSIVINDKFHVFNDGKHMIWDNNTKTFISDPNIPNDLNIHCCGIILIPSQHFVLKLGGISTIGHQTKIRDTIYSYNIMKKVWNKLNLKLPKPLRSSGYTITNDTRFVIIFGGVSTVGTVRDIFILDTMEMIIKKSKLRLPFCKIYQAIIPNNKINEELTCHGYIRNIWRMDGFHLLIYPPFYLVQLIASYYTNNYVYLIDVDKYSKRKHWKIKVDDIFT